MTTYDAMGAIQRVTTWASGRPLRCAGCFRGRGMLPEHAEFVDLGPKVFRGCVVDPEASGVLERIEDAVLCSECVSLAMAQLDPDADDARQEVEAEQERLRALIRHYTKMAAENRAKIEEHERRIRDLEAERDKREALRGAVRQWVARHTQAVDRDRALARRLWLLEASEHIDERAAAGAGEVRAERKRVRAELKKLRPAAARLSEQCLERRLFAEGASIDSRLNDHPDSQERQ